MAGARIEDAGKAFDKVYNEDHWQLSSPGSWAQAEGFEPWPVLYKRLVRLVQDIIGGNEIKSVVEFGCGRRKLSRMDKVDWTGVEYDGFDVVKAVIDDNNRDYANSHTRFHQVKDGVFLPPADLLISKDVLQHLPTADVKYYTDIFRRNYRYCLLGNDAWPEDNVNGDIEPGQCRALRLEREPFNWPNIVVQRWELHNFGIHSMKHFCLFEGVKDLSEAKGATLQNTAG